MSKMNATGGRGRIRGFARKTTRTERFGGAEGTRKTDVFVDYTCNHYKIVALGRVPSPPGNRGRARAHETGTQSYGQIGSVSRARRHICPIAYFGRRSAPRPAVALRPRTCGAMIRQNDDASRDARGAGGVPV